MIDDDKSLFGIGAVSDLIDEHPETLRVWERNNLIRPDRTRYQRRYSHNDIKRLKFIKHMIDINGLNLAGVRQITSMYPCWYNESCRGGQKAGGKKAVNQSKPCWKKESTYCVQARDKSEFCSSCNIMKKCSLCNKSKCNSDNEQ